MGVLSDVRRVNTQYCKSLVEQVHSVLLSHVHQESAFRPKGVWRGSAKTTGSCLYQEEPRTFSWAGGKKSSKMLLCMWRVKVSTLGKETELIDTRTNEIN